MSHTFFSFIHGGSVKIAPKTKLVKAEDFSTLLAASDVLKAVQEDADKHRVEVMKECELLKELAEKQGFEAGFQNWVEHIAKFEEEIKRVRSEMENLVIPVALKAAKKIVGRELELSENTIVDIVANCLKAISQHKKITIYVNKKELEAVEAERAKLKDCFESLESLSIREKIDVLPGGCVIETEGGIINAQLENQWRILEQVFETLIKKTKTAN